MLLGRRQPRVQRQDLGAAQVRAVQHVGGVADLALAGEEHQDVARALGAQLLDGLEDALGLVALVVAFGVVRVDQRPVARLDRVRPAGDLDDRRVVEVLREALGVDGRRGDDDLEVGAARQQLLEVAEDEVDVEAALVGLVDDEGVVLAQRAVGLDLGQQDAVGHQLDQRVLPGLVGEPHLVPDGVAELGLQLAGDPVGDRARCQPARLRVADLAADAAAELEADLRQLGGLARAGLPRDDHDLVLLDRRADLVLELADRQLFGVFDLGHARAARREAQLGLFDVGGDPREGGIAVASLAGAVEPPAQPLLVARHQLGQARTQRFEGG